MIERELELSVGDTIQVGDHVVTVIDIDGPEVRFRVEEGGEVGVVFEIGQRVVNPR